MKIALPILLQGLSLIVMLAEWVIPSFGLLSVLAFGLFGLSWYYLINNFSGAIPLIFGIVDILLLPICIYFGIKLFKASPLANAQKLAQGDGMSSQQSLLGKLGVVETTLRPFGKILVEGKLIEATSGGEPIEKGTQVVIKKINGMNVTVNPSEPLNS